MQIEKSTGQTYIKKRIDELTPGDILLHPLYRSDGLLLVDRYKQLNEALINIIKKHVIPHAYLLIAPTKQDFINFSNNDSNNKDFKNDLQQLIKNYNDSNDKIHDGYVGVNIKSTDNPIINALTSCPYWNFFDSKLESDRLKQRAVHIKSELLNLISNNYMFINFFNKIKAYDDILVIHSLNITCVSLAVGITLELVDEELLDLAIAGLFSNIGYTEMPHSDFKNLLRTQEYNNPAMKKNLELFSNITKSSPYLRKRNIILGILDQYEYYNGKGFPSEKKGEEISLFGRILNIA
ncbi:MAG: hypothetical protein PHF63_03485, partial [Herbinix sp.]|nr:hypothetical protein [Herbinix sp.]